MATIRDVAEKANVSVATVSYVINGIGKVSKEKRKMVLEAIEKLNYNPNLNARALSKGESKLIGILLPLVEKDDEVAALIGSNPFYMEFIAGVECVLQNKGYDIVLANSYNSEDFKKWLTSRSLDGIIIFGSTPKNMYNIIEELQIPCCLVDGDVNYGKLSVNIDDELGEYLATKHLIDLGHTRIGFLCSSLAKSNVNRNRYEGYVKALKEAGLKVNEEYIFEDEVSFEAGIRIARKIINKKLDITGVVCTSDILAIGVIKAYNDMKISIPSSLSVVGFDDIKMSSYITPTLTTIKQDVALKGRKATEILLANLDNKTTNRIILIPSLIVRESTSTYFKETNYGKNSN